MVDIKGIAYTPEFFFVCYLIIINVYGISIMGIDKWRSSRRKSRVPEKHLFLVAFIGGAVGIYGGMKAFHHKTLHNKFKYGIPIIMIVDIALIVFIFYKI